jgi:iron complex outermembrane receptor protein
MFPVLQITKARIGHRTREHNVADISISQWRPILLAGALFTTSVVSTTASAADSASIQPAQGDGLEEIVVTAQKRSERLQDVPISIAVLQGSDIDKSSFLSVTDLLGTIAGVSTLYANQGGGTELTVRGASAAGFLFAGSSPIGYYVDGVPFGLAQSALVPDTDPYDLSRIEVLRGPQGTLYGASSENGVVRILTNDPDLNDFDFKTRGIVSTTNRGGGNQSGDAAANLPIIDGVLAARLVVGEQKLSGWIDSPLGTHINDEEITNLRLKVLAQPTDGLQIGISAWRFGDQSAAPATSLENGYTPSTLQQPLATHFGAYGMHIKEDFPFFTISSDTSYLDYTNRSLLDLAPGATGYNPPLGTFLDSRVYSEEINLNSNLTGPWKWSLGAIYRNGKDNYTQTLGADIPAPLVWDNTSKSEAVYGELRYRFMQSLEITVGARVFQEKEGTKQLAVFIPGVPFENAEVADHKITPRVVLTWEPLPTLTAYSSYSQGFRGGTTQTLFVNGTDTGVPNAKPDTLNNYEIGAKGTLFDKRLSFDADIYYIDWQHVQESIGIEATGSNLPPGTFYSAIGNAISASGQGVDLGLTANPTDRLTMGVTFGWNSLHLNHTYDSFGAPAGYEGTRLPNRQNIRRAHQCAIHSQSAVVG